jgi:hypothetical protein
VKRFTDLDQDFDRQARLIKFLRTLPHFGMITQMLGEVEGAEKEERLKNAAALYAKYQHLAMALDAYFQMTQNPIKERQLKLSTEADLLFYLAFYHLIWFGWDDIQAEISNRGLADVYPYKEPGDMLEAFFLMECHRGFEVICNKTFCENKREAMNLFKGKALLVPSKNEQAEKRRMRTLEYGNVTLGIGSPAVFLASVCEDGVRKRLKGNPSLQYVWAEYRKKKSAYITATKKFLKGSA